MTKHFKDAYGGCASITQKRDGSASLIIRIYTGKVVKNSVHKNLSAARAAMNRFGDGWTEVNKEYER